jgi:hypothetical protein
VVWGVMLTIAAVLIWWFKRRGWLERSGRPPRDDR